MHCAVIDYYNSEKEILVLKKKYFDNIEEFNDALYLYNSLITNLIAKCKESYLLDTYQSYLLKINEDDKKFIKGILDSLKPSEHYDEIYDIIYNIMVNCIKDRNEEYAFKVLYDIVPLKKGNTISKEMYILLEQLLNGDEDGLENEYFVRQHKINIEHEIYVRNIMNSFPNEKDNILPSKSKKRRK